MEEPKPVDDVEASSDAARPSRVVVLTAGLVVLVMCALWLSCHEAAESEKTTPAVQQQ